MKTIWTGRLTEAAARYGDHAPMAATCCNACRACVTTNVAALAAAGATALAAYAGRFVRRLVARS